MLNKVRLIKIYELKGKVHPIEQYVIDLFDDTEKYIYYNYINYMKDGNIYMKHYLGNDVFWFSYPYIWRVFKNKFNCSNQESKIILKYLIEKKMLIKNIKIIPSL